MRNIYKCNSIFVFYFFFLHRYSLVIVCCSSFLFLARCSSSSLLVVFFYSFSGALCPIFSAVATLAIYGPRHSFPFLSTVVVCLHHLTYKHNSRSFSFLMFRMVYVCMQFSQNLFLAAASVVSLAGQVRCCNALLLCKENPEMTLNDVKNLQDLSVWKQNGKDNGKCLYVC